MLLAAQFTFTACDDDTDITPSEVPAVVMETFTSMFSNVNAQWELEGSLYKADFLQNGREVEAWFSGDGKWTRTDYDITTAELPEAVTNYVSTNYAGYVIEDADRVETPLAHYYELELEKKGKPDVILLLNADGEKL